MAAECLAIYPPIPAINGGPPFHARCVHVLTPFVDLPAGREDGRLATEEEKKQGIISPELLNRSPVELQRRFRKEFPDIARRASRRQSERKRLLANPFHPAVISKKRILPREGKGEGEGEGEKKKQSVAYPHQRGSTIATRIMATGSWTRDPERWLLSSYYLLNKIAYRQ